jgi:hypothetical protein
VPTVLLVERRLRGRFAYTQALAALITAPVTVRETLNDAGGRRQRRFVLDVALRQGWFGLHDLLAVVESDDDVWIRARAAEAACREAVWTRRVMVLRCLARARPERVCGVAGSAGVVGGDGW